MRPSLREALFVSILGPAAWTFLVLAASNPVFAIEEVRAKHILVDTEQEAAAVRQEIVAKGGDQKAFSAAAREHSKDATTKVLGGDLGWFNAKSGFDPAFADETLEIGTEAAQAMTARLAREEGLLVGISSGAAALAALQVAARLERGVVVTVFPDSGMKYLSDLPFRAGAAAQ